MPSIFAIIFTPDAKFVKSFLILAKYLDENFCIKFFAFVKSFSRLYKVFVSKVFEVPCRSIFLSNNFAEYFSRGR